MLAAAPVASRLPAHFDCIEMIGNSAILSIARGSSAVSHVGGVTDRRARLQQLLAIAGLCALGCGASEALRRAGAPGAMPVEVADAGTRRARAELARHGALYLADHPWESDRTRLVGLLGGAAPAPGFQGLVDAITRDWRNHDIAVVDGWVLARTEARICALTWLMGAQAA